MRVDRMAMALRVTCVKKREGVSVHERISDISGVDSDGSPWSLSLAAAIAKTESRKLQFYVKRNGRLLTLVIGRSAWGEKYLKTEDDGDWPEGLLQLPECETEALAR